jgi:nucleotide-binding universal stress UspA family protein
MKPRSEPTTPSETSGRPCDRVLMVAVDGSEQSMWAVQVACGLAGPLRADVVLVHVMNTDAAAASTEVALTERELLAVLRRRADGIFEAADARLAPGMNVHRVLREGNPAKEVVASAAEWKANLLVIGTHARGRVASFLLGSTAEAVIRTAPCPVITVSHEPAGAPPRPAPGAAVMASPAR